MSRSPIPLFDPESAAQNARMAEDAWSRRDPACVSLANTPDNHSRNRSEFLEGRPAIVAFPTREWLREHGRWLIKEARAFRENRIAVHFAYEWHDDEGQWFNSHGNQNGKFDGNGPTRLRIASIKDLPIKTDSHLFHWTQPRRPDDHPGLGEIGL